MADEDKMTESLGHVPITSAEKQLKGWDDYIKKAAAYTTARRANEEAKRAMKETMKQQYGLGGNIDFTVVGDNVNIFKVLAKKEGRRRSRDLSINLPR